MLLSCPDTRPNLLHRERIHRSDSTGIRNYEINPSKSVLSDHLRRHGFHASNTLRTAISSSNPALSIGRFHSGHRFLRYAGSQQPGCPAMRCCTLDDLHCAFHVPTGPCPSSLMVGDPHPWSMAVAGSNGGLTNCLLGCLSWCAVSSQYLSFW